MRLSNIKNWDALHAALEHDEDGSAIEGTAELVDCHNLFGSSNGPRVSIIDLEDAIVVVDGDLVTARTGAQRVGKLAGAVNQ